MNDGLLTENLEETKPLTDEKVNEAIKEIIKMGRPSDYSQELGDRICNELSEGISLRTVCLAEDMPSKTTVFRWLRENKEFRNQYATAKDESADALFEETIDIADGSVDEAKQADPKASGAVVNAIRLKVDTRKWMMSKMKPKKYGDKLDMTTNGKDLPVPLLHALQKEIPTVE